MTFDDARSQIVIAITTALDNADAATNFDAAEAIVDHIFNASNRFKIATMLDMINAKEPALPLDG